jgi:hypothetical protein
MTWQDWLSNNWFTGLNTVAIIAALIYPQISLRRDERSRRVGNLFQLTGQHHDVWSQLFTKPELKRLLRADVDITQHPATAEEMLFITFLVLNLNSAHYAIKNRLIDSPRRLGTDIRTFFARPIPRAVWTDIRHFQDDDFVAFVESHFAPEKS